MNTIPKSFFQTTSTEDFKTFLQWTLDHYPKVQVSDSLNNYWQALNIYFFDQYGRKLNNNIRRDIINVIDLTKTGKESC